jgi:hypothetical protein
MNHAKAREVWLAGILFNEKSNGVSPLRGGDSVSDGEDIEHVGVERGDIVVNQGTFVMS